MARRLAMVGVELLGYVYNGTPSSTRFAPYFPIVRGASAAPLIPARPHRDLASPLPVSPPSSTPPPAVPDHSVEPQTATVATVTREAEAETGQVPAVNTYGDDTGIVPVNTHGRRLTPCRETAKTNGSSALRRRCHVRVILHSLGCHRGYQDFI